MADYFEKAFNLSLDRIFEKYKDVDDSLDSIVEFDVEVPPLVEKSEVFYYSSDNISKYTEDQTSEFSFYNFSFVKNKERGKKIRRTETVDNFNRLYNIINEGPYVDYDDLYNLIFHNGY